MLKKIFSYSFIVFFLFLSIISVNYSIQDLQDIPRLSQPVTDLTKTLSIKELQSLNHRLSLFEKKHGSQIAILIIPSTKPEAIEDYSLRVVEKWKLGRKKIDDGVLLLLALQDRKVRIEVGYGLEGVLTDIHSKQIIETILIPSFKTNAIFKGLNSGVDAISTLISTGNLPPSQKKLNNLSRRKHNTKSTPFLPTALLSVFCFFIFRSLFGTFVGSGVGLILSCILGYFILGSILQILLIALLGFTFGNKTMLSTMLLAGMLGGGRGGGFGGAGGGGGGGFGGGGASGGW